MQIALQHMIGTVALISLVITAGLAYNVITYSVQADVSMQQLKQVSEYVSLNIVEMTNLIKFSLLSNDNPMVKNLHLPTDLSGKSYQIELIKNADSNQGYIVRSYLTTQKTIYANVTVPLNFGDSPVELVLDKGNFVAGADNTQIQYNGTIYGKDTAVVWGRAQWNDDTGELVTIQVGIGWRS